LTFLWRKTSIAIEMPAEYINDYDGKRDKAARREGKKSRRRFRLHGSNLWTIYQDAIRKRLRQKK